MPSNIGCSWTLHKILDWSVPEVQERWSSRKVSRCVARIDSYIPKMSKTWVLMSVVPSGVIKRGKLGNPLEMVVLIGKSPINSICFIAMFDSRRVYHGIYPHFFAETLPFCTCSNVCWLRPELVGCNSASAGYGNLSLLQTQGCHTHLGQAPWNPAWIEI